MNRDDLIKKITEKKEFSELPKKDVLIALERFDNGNYSYIEKIKLTRNLLRNVFSSFTSQKILSLRNLKNRDEEWFLRKHVSTKERLSFYKIIYERIFEKLNLEKEVSVIDLGAGINGFSYVFFDSLRRKLSVNYVAVEAIGQLTELMNRYFKNKKINKKARAVHLSLFELEKVKNLIKKTISPRIVFLFKTLDSLERLDKNYSKKFLLEIVPISDICVVSFATKSMSKREKFKAKRNWIMNFIEGNFFILDDFEISGERYFVVKNR